MNCVRYELVVWGRTHACAINGYLLFEFAFQFAFPQTDTIRLATATAASAATVDNNFQRINVE